MIPGDDLLPELLRDGVSAGFEAGGFFSLSAPEFPVENPNHEHPASPVAMNPPAIFVNNSRRFIVELMIVRLLEYPCSRGVSLQSDQPSSHPTGKAAGMYDGLRAA